ncbi:MAG: AMP-binding protein [Acidimicrobiales bacterium]
MLSDQIDASRIQSMDGMDIPWMLSQWVRRSPDKVAVVWEPFTGDRAVLTYAELQAQARSLAAGLHERGVRSGDFVIIHLDNSLEFLIAWYGCAELGAVAVSTNTHSVARDLSYFSDHVSAVCAITQPTYAQLMFDSCPELRFVAVTDNDAGEPPAAPIDALTFDAVPFADLLSNGQPPELPADPMRNLSVQFTSGTTSRPKAVLWTHANGLWAGKVSAIHMRLRNDDTTIAFMPLFHTNAQGYSMLATHWSGGTLVVQPKFSASRFWDVSIANKATWLSTIPFAFKAIANQPVPDHHYRMWGTAAHLPSIAEHFGVQVMGWWGMTETLTHGIVTDYDQPGPSGTIGRVAPEYELQIRDDDGSIVGPGGKGVLHVRGVRGVSLFKEYYGNPQANADAFDENGWFNTGDVIRIDDDGWLYFSDRSKDMLKVGAENVAASEIESVIMMTGLVDECAVVAQKHFMLDEIPVVFVIPLPGADTSTMADTIIEHCRANLADFKVVRDVHIVDELPRSMLNKVAKAELRSRLPEITQS